MRDDSILRRIAGGDGAGEPGAEPERQKDMGDDLRPSATPRAATVIDNSGGAYPTEDWQALYFNTDHRGVLTEHAVRVRVPAGLAAACTPIRLGDPGCVYAVRRWGFALRPSALDEAGFDPTPLLTTGDDAEFLRAMLRAAAFELPGEFVIASPEHPFRLVAPDGQLRGSFIGWRTYLGALSYYVSGGKVNASFIRFWAESEDSYRQAVEFCLEALRNPGDP